MRGRTSRAQRHRQLPATEREQRFAHAVQAWCDDDIGGAIRLLDEQLRAHPRDLAALKLAQYFCFNLGDAAAMLRLALGSQDAAADVPYLHGMTAFGYEQCHQMRRPSRPRDARSRCSRRSRGRTTRLRTSC